MRTRLATLLAAFRSPIGKKIWTGITGLGLTLFVLVHMSGNLSYFSEVGAYNLYSEFLLGLGPIFYAIEIGLLLFFAIHALIGINIWLGKRKAREVNYKKYRSSGSPSRQTLSSRTMIVTGSILLVFLVVHLGSFKFGPSIEDGYIADPMTGESIVLSDTDQANEVGFELGPNDVATVDGQPVIRDMRRLLEEKFSNALYAFSYPIVMLLLAFHLRHGVWSAFQSLGATNPRLTPVIYTLGGLLGLLIAVGFLVLPLYIFFSQ